MAISLRSFTSLSFADPFPEKTDATAPLLGDLKPIALLITNLRIFCKYESFVSGNKEGSQAVSAWT